MDLRVEKPCTMTLWGETVLTYPEIDPNRMEVMVIVDVALKSSQQGQQQTGPPRRFFFWPWPNAKKNNQIDKCGQKDTGRTPQSSSKF